MGWLSPLALNLAWYANPFFIYAVFKIINGKAPYIPALIALVLALDTFRFGLLPSGSGYGYPVYGYGWGAILWLLAIFLLQFSIYIKKQGLDGQKINGTSIRSYLFLPSGISILVILLCFYFAVHDRAVANDAELAKLRNIAFKRGKVCEAPPPVAMFPIRNFSGALEIVINGPTLYAKYPFAQTKDILEWGVPVVRIANTEFTLEKISQDSVYWKYQELWGRQAKLPPTATLFITEEYLKTINAKLIETKTNRVVFDQTWTREDLPLNINFYCPSYQSFPTENDQPRKLIMQALNLSDSHPTSGQ